MPEFRHVCFAGEMLPYDGLYWHFSGFNFQDTSERETKGTLAKHEMGRQKRERTTQESRIPLSDQSQSQKLQTTVIRGQKSVISEETLGQQQEIKLSTDKEGGGGGESLSPIGAGIKP